ncbi:ribosomal protein S7 domain-containing protein [Flammula alnicola]|nr:ribosomal protein S7 domain-containing protein [Flammula alnicola]
MLHFLTTMIMRHGLYAQAAKVTSQMLLHIHAMTRSPPMPIVEHAILAASPSVRCRRQKQRGGKATLVPMALSERQRTHLGILWIREAAEKKSSPGKKLEERLAREMIAVLKGTSSALENKDKMHKEAMVNRGLLSRRG